ncbi:MAG: TolC family protein [Flavobacteriales bacterium]|mgnify:CR=1 FL=1|jgi:outer membrane protein TolC|nr:TolC family protein [Flavobacteriales bacterium]MBK7287483.1 TolC family protein [Flavobacteriales bacterium]MBK9598525.1 TolC family protein [Flavobacteriales bacterium]QQS73432.1 MAG: TolC family protein [Flavobacteriales bacterium]HQV39866.1 TolC family protein [Flavobacteriales bacterium]
MRRIAFAMAAALMLPAAAQQLTADGAVRIALENNHGVRIARNSAAIAKLANNPGAAGMLPSVDANGAYSVDNSATKQEFFTGENREADNANAKSLSGEVELNWTLFDGLSMFAAKDRLEAVERIGESQLRQEVEGTTYDVLTGYYQLVQLEKAVLVQREAMQTSRERLKITETGERVGASSGLELVQARLDLSTDSAQMLALLQRTAMARTGLNTLLARDPGTAFEVDTMIPPAEALELPALQEAALAANTTLQQAREERMVADLSVKELRGTLLPKLNGFANYGYSRSTSEVGFLKSNQRLGPQYGLTLSVPLFRGGAIKAVKQAKLAVEQADLSLQQTQLELQRDILDTWSQYENARQRVALEEANLGGSRTQMQVALESYRIGVSTAVQLRDVQQGVVTAENRLLTAQFEAKVAELQLRWLAGKLF